MNPQEALEAWEATPERLVVRNFVTFDGQRGHRNIEISSLFLNFDRGSWSSVAMQSPLGSLPFSRLGTWSNKKFRERNLFPLLAEHPLWLVGDQVVTVARFPDGSDVVAPPIGRLLAQQLQLAVVCLEHDGHREFAHRLKAILREYNHRLSLWDLLV